VTIGWYGFALWLGAALVGLGQAEPHLPPGISASLWALMLVSSALSFLGQMLMTIALQRLEAGPVQVLSTLEIVWSFIWQITFLHTSPSARSALGALTIISCAALVAVQKMVASRAAAAPVPSAAGGDEGAGADQELGEVGAAGQGADGEGVAMEYRARGHSMRALRDHMPLPVAPAPDTPMPAGEDGQAIEAPHSKADCRQADGLHPRDDAPRLEQAGALCTVAASPDERPRAHAGAPSPVRPSGG
jgi:uncharacterized membrane protein